MKVTQKYAAFKCQHSKRVHKIIHVKGTEIY